MYDLRGPVNITATADHFTEMMVECCLYLQGQTGLDGMVGAKGLKGERGPKVWLSLLT